MLVKIGICLAGRYLAVHAPMLFLKEPSAKRQLSLKRAFSRRVDLFC